MVSLDGGSPLYLLDANVLIDAARDYYPMDQVPEFWDWVVYQGEQGHLKIPREIYDEIVAGKGELPTWISDAAIKKSLLLGEEPDLDLVRRVIEQGYAPDLTEDEVESLGRDPFLIAYAMADPKNRYVVTGEKAKPSKQRANRKVPDVCDSLRVEHKWKYELTADLGFSTKWQRSCPSEQSDGL